MTSTATHTDVSPSVSNESPTNSSSNNKAHRNRVLTPVVVCGSPCVSYQKEGQQQQLLSPLLTAAAASNARVNSGGNVLLQNNVPASESEKLTATNIHVLREVERPRPRPTDIESTVCPPAVEPFRKAWWAGVRPTTCERTCRHRSKVCDAIQLCNDCTGYYCKWLAELVGIPVLKASGRVDPLLFERDPLAKLYWERISKVACCPKTNLKCLMCIRRYQLFTHFLPGNLDFRSLVHESVMKLHEEGFAVDMGLIRKVTRRHLECIADGMELRLPVEYMSSFHAYDIIVRRGPLVDVLANGLSSALHGGQQNYQSGNGDARTPSNSSPQHGSSGNRFPIVVSPTHRASSRSPASSTRSAMDALNQSEQTMKDALMKDTQTLSTSDSIGGTSPRDSSQNKAQDEEGIFGSNRRKLRRHHSSNGVLSDILVEEGKVEENNNKRRSRRQVKRPLYNHVEDMYYGEDQDFLSMLDDNEQDSEESDGERGRKKKRRGGVRRGNSKDLSSSLSGFGFEHQFSHDLNRDMGGNSFDSLVNQFKSASSTAPEVSIDTETFQTLCRTKGGRGSRQATREGMWVPNSALKGSKVLRHHNMSRMADLKLDEQSKFDLADGSPGAIDRLAVAFLQRFDNQRPRSSPQQESVISESIHRQQLAEESRLGECGVQGVFWDPAKEGWCALLPLLPSMIEDGAENVKRKILCFTANTWKSFESAKWSAVYERLRRNPRELDFLSQDVRQDLSNWVRDHIESASSTNEEEPLPSSSMQQEASMTSGHGQKDLDISNLDRNSLAAELDASNANQSSGRLADLLGSLAKHMATLGKGNDGSTSSQNEATTTASTTAKDDEAAITTTTGGGDEHESTSSSHNEQQFPTSILGILTSLQSRFSADQASQGMASPNQQLKSERNE